jgi:hypothetical protein
VPKSGKNEDVALAAEGMQVVENMIYHNLNPGLAIRHSPACGIR